MSQDLYIDCCDCGEEFVFTAGDQEYFSQKGYEDPKRCQGCRAARKGRRPDNFGNRRTTPDHVDRRDRDRGRYNTEEVLLDERAHYKIRCRSCREEAFVPFFPKGPACCQRCHHEQKTRTGGRTVGARH